MLSGECEHRRLILNIFLSDLSRCPRFSFVIASTEINKVNEFRTSRDSKVQFKFIFLIDVVLGVAVVVSEAPYFFPLTRYPDNNL